MTHRGRLMRVAPAVAGTRDLFAHDPRTPGEYQKRTCAPSARTTEPISVEHSQQVQNQQD